MCMDCKPALSMEQLDARILREFQSRSNMSFKNSLNQLLPKTMIPVIIRRSGISPEKKVNEITKEQRTNLCQNIKGLTYTITGARDFKEAIITQGGISTSEIDPSTMESKKVSGLFFAGEVLDLDALTGGFNLQIAWSTGHLAGSTIE